MYLLILNSLKKKSFIQASKRLILPKIKINGNCSKFRIDENVVKSYLVNLKVRTASGIVIVSEDRLSGNEHLIYTHVVF